MSCQVAVLYGGMSREREISLISGQAVHKSLLRLGYRTTLLDVQSDISIKLSELRPDIAFIALHGRYGEDGCIQGLLEILSIKYTHSTICSSAIAIDKHLCKELFQVLHIPTPRWLLSSRKELIHKQSRIGYPQVIKPVSEGSSIGVKMCFNEKDREYTENFNKLIIEEYIPGHELHTAVVQGKALGTIEIVPVRDFYDYKTKYTPGLAQHLLPPDIPKHVYAATLKYAEQIYSFLQCRDIARVDFRYDDKGDRLMMLEINTHPGFTPLSLVPKIARYYHGITFDELIMQIIENGLKQ